MEKPEEHYLRLKVIRNGLQDNQSYEDIYNKVEDNMCNVKKHELYLIIDYEELQKVKLCSIRSEEDDAEFSMMNPILLNLDL